MVNATIEKVRQQLEKQKDNIEKQVSRLKKEDPFLQHDRSLIDEPGTESFEEEGHTRVASSIKESEGILSQIKKALSKIGIGKYGICENCGAAIDPKRLEAFPMATLCLNCEKNQERRKR